jgi:hypothetical protein
MIFALQEMVRQVRRFTIELLAVDNREMYLWAPAGTSNHMIWHAGHVLWVQDALCVEPLVGNSELPEGWAKKFGQDCDPVTSQTDWPDQRRLQELLSEQERRLIELVGDLRDDQLVVDADRPTNLVGGIIHGLHDEGRHQGEMYLLLKQFAAMAK